MITPQSLPLAEVYIDESSHTNHRYLVLGGIIAEINDSEMASNAIAKARLPELPSGILKWVKVSNNKLPAYKRAVDCFFDMQEEMTLDFHSVVVDTTKQRHQRYNQGSQEIGFNKELYQLAMKFGRLYPCLLHVYPDRRTTNEKPEDLRLMLNRGIKKRHNDMRDWPFRRVQFREPEASQLLQLADVFSGAIAWTNNGHANRFGASRAKTELAEYILGKATIRDASRDTPRSYQGFTIWHRQLRT